MRKLILLVASLPLLVGGCGRPDQPISASAAAPTSSQCSGEEKYSSAYKGVEFGENGGTSFPSAVSYFQGDYVTAAVRWGPDLITFSTPVNGEGLEIGAQARRFSVALDKIIVQKQLTAESIRAQGTWPEGSAGGAAVDRVTAAVASADRVYFVWGQLIDRKMQGGHLVALDPCSLEVLGSTRLDGDPPVVPEFNELAFDAKFDRVWLAHVNKVIAFDSLSLAPIDEIAAPEGWLNSCLATDDQGLLWTSNNETPAQRIAAGNVTPLPEYSALNQNCALNAGGRIFVAQEGQLIDISQRTATNHPGVQSASDVGGDVWVLSGGTISQVGGEGRIDASAVNPSWIIGSPKNLWISSHDGGFFSLN